MRKYIFLLNHKQRKGRRSISYIYTFELENAEYIIHAPYTCNTVCITQLPGTFLKNQTATNENNFIVLENLLSHRRHKTLLSARSSKNHARNMKSSNLIG